MTTIQPHDVLYVGHRARHNKLWSWDAGSPQPDDMPHEVWRKAHDTGRGDVDAKSRDGQPQKLKPGTDYNKVTITSESIMIEGNGYRARAEHAAESSGNMSVGRVVDVTETT